MYLFTNYFKTSKAAPLSFKMSLFFLNNNIFTCRHERFDIFEDLKKAGVQGIFVHNIALLKRVSCKEVK